MYFKMFLFLYIFFLAGSVFADTSNEAPYYNLEEAGQLFEEFIITHDKKYPSAENKQVRFEIFKENLRKINEKNAIGGVVFIISHTADLTEEEFVRRYLGYNLLLGNHSCEEKTQVEVTKPAPVSLNWVEKGAVTPPKDQGHYCGSCWAFATIANIESQYILKTGKANRFSEQQLVDCSDSNFACSGGGAPMAMSDIMDLGGVELESDYPYKKYTDQEHYIKDCRFERSKVATNIASCTIYRLDDEDDLKQLLVENGPVAVGLNGHALGGYHNGIYTKGHCTDIVGESDLHAVLLVGYGTENGQDYWLLKNSWGSVWGENGFFRLSRGENTCGIMHVTLSGGTFPMYSSTVQF